LKHAASSGGGSGGGVGGGGWTENAGPENAGPQKHDRKLADKLPEVIRCRTALT